MDNKHTSGKWGSYTVELIETNSWNMDGSAIIIRDCGHKHRSLKAAIKCYDKLLGYNPEQAVRIYNNRVDETVRRVEIDDIRYLAYNARGK